MTLTDLYFHSSKRKFFTGMAQVSAVGLGFAATGWAILTFVPPDRASADFRSTAVLAVIAGALIILFALIALPAQARMTRRRWGQFYPPTVAFKADGAWFLPERGPVLVPWPDIERVTVRRVVYSKSTSTTVSLRLMRGAAPPWGGAPVRSATDRNLDIGYLSDTHVPEDAAIWFLEQVGGPRLTVRDIDGESKR